MLRVERRTTQVPASDVLALPYDDRKKSRLRARTEKGREVAIVLERGSVLRDGDLLAAEGGEVLLVRSAPEAVSDVYTADARLLARAAYHLGNRHVPLQIELGSLRYQHDHVLDAMLRELGLEVVVRTAAFEPEPGAYAHGGAAPDHTHGPGGHTHSRERNAEPHTHGAHNPAHDAEPLAHGAQSHGAHPHEPAGRSHAHSHQAPAHVHAGREHDHELAGYTHGAHSHGAHNHETAPRPHAHDHAHEPAGRTAQSHGRGSV